MNDKTSFWTTLPGILTGIAALITATGGIIAVLYQIGVIGDTDQKEDERTQLLAAPIPEHPTCGNVIKTPPDTEFLIMNWAPIDGASTYTVEVDCFGCGQYPNSWYSLSGNPWHIKPGLGRRTLGNPIYSSKIHVMLREAGGTSIRWRVWAVDSEGRKGHRSNWCQLAFYGG